MVQKQKEEEDMEEFQTNKILHENKVCVVFLISNPKLLTLKSQSCFFLKVELLTSREVLIPKLYSESFSSIRIIKKEKVRSS